jgi:hypothetical protein
MAEIMVQGEEQKGMRNFFLGGGRQVGYLVHVGFPLYRSKNIFHKRGRTMVF